MELSPVPKRDIKSNDTADDPGSDTAGLLPTQSRALVPLVPQDSPQTTCYVRSHPDLSFVAHLIATATHVPQTRTLCRASPQDAQASYRSVANQNKTPARPPGTPRVA